MLDCLVRKFDFGLPVVLGGTARIDEWATLVRAPGTAKPDHVLETMTCRYRGAAVASYGHAAGIRPVTGNAVRTSNGSCVRTQHARSATRYLPNYDMAGMDSPRVSVIIPTYNRAHLIDRALSSVFRQTIQDFEILVIDDASTDDTEAVVRRIADARVRYIRHSANKKAAAARNTGVASAQGVYVAFLDSDDEWLPNKLEVQLAVFERSPDTQIVYSGWRWVHESTGLVEKVRCPDSSGRIDGLPRWAFNIVPDILIRRNVALRFPFDERTLSYDSFAYLFTIWPGCKVGFASEVLMTCYVHGGARASDRSDRVKYLDALVNRHELFLRSDRAGWAHLNFTLGAVHLRHHVNLRAARPYLWRALRANPLSGRAWMYAVASLISPIFYPERLRARIFRTA